MDNETKYEYRAIDMGDGAWMVQRIKRCDSWDEQLLNGHFADADAAIKRAIEVNSWA
jgi:hypothetical protein